MLARVLAPTVGARRRRVSPGLTTVERRVELRRRVLILIKGLGRGGAEQLLVSAAPFLDTSRFDYRVAYLLPAKDALVGDLRDRGLDVHCLGGSGPGWLGRLRALVGRDGIDLVHSHLPFTGVGARLALPNSVHVYTEHNEWDCYKLSTRWSNLLTLGMCDHVFAVAERVRSSMRYPTVLSRTLRMPTVEVLYQGIDIDTVGRPTQADGVRAEFGLPAAAPLVGTVANFRAEKALDHLVEAADIVRRAVPDVRFLLVGQGATEGKLRSLVRDRHLERTVIFAGHRSDVPRIMAAFDVFAMSSLHEGLSIALIEAMALSRPVVVTAVGGQTEVVQHGTQGLVVPPGEPSSIARSILTLLGDEGMRSRMGEAGRARALTFDIRHSVARTQEVYEELLS